MTCMHCMQYATGSSTRAEDPHIADLWNERDNKEIQSASTGQELGNIHVTQARLSPGPPDRWTSVEMDFIVHATARRIPCPREVSWEREPVSGLDQAGDSVLPGVF